MSYEFRTRVLRTPPDVMRETHEGGRHTVSRACGVTAHIDRSDIFTGQIRCTRIWEMRSGLPPFTVPNFLSGGARSARRIVNRSERRVRDDEGSRNRRAGFVGSRLTERLTAATKGTSPGLRPSDTARVGHPERGCRIRIPRYLINITWRDSLKDSP